MPTKNSDGKKDSVHLKHTDDVTPKPFIFPSSLKAADVSDETHVPTLKVDDKDACGDIHEHPSNKTV